jgi:hypothetical protein
MEKRFEITQEFEAFDQDNNISRTFSVGTKFYGSYSSDKQTVIYQGFTIPVEYVKTIANTKQIFIYAGISIVVIVAVILIVKKIRKK